MKVLCAIDGSEFSHWGVESVGALAGRPPKTLVLLHVLDTSEITSSKGIKQTLKEQSINALEKAGQSLLQRMKEAATLELSQQARGRVTKIHSVLARGTVPETIIRQTQRQRVDLILIGSRGFSDARGFLLGSVSRKVVSHAPCPVLVIKRRLPPTLRIVLAMDYSKYSKKALQFLLATFAGEQCHITILSEVAPVVNDLGREVLTSSQLEALTKPKEEQINTVVKQYREMFLKEGYAVSTQILKGHTSQTIIHYLEDHHVDLVVMGSRGLTGTERLQMGSVSESVLKYAPCSFLVVRGRST